jgi:hypothetical protein
MNANGTNKELNSNPEDLHVYRKSQHHDNTTPAGVAQPMFIVHFYKHVMPPASLLPPKSRGKSNCLHETRTSAPFNVAKAFSLHEICKPSAKADGN